jgi:UDP-glucuronate decarboxylase
MKKVVLLTGSTGFVGRQTISFLLKKGYEVHAISTQPSYPHHPDIIWHKCNWHKCNLFHAQEITNLMQKIRPAYLLHFAWITTSGVAVSSPENLIWMEAPENLTWMEASIRLVRIFVENGGKRVVVAGSCSEYESTPLCSEEENSFRATTFYGQCKRNLYITLENFARQMNFELAWGYIFYLYGPYERSNRFLPTVIRGILQKKEIPLTEGLQIRDFLHVREVAEGFVELLDSSIQGCFNIASGEGVSIRKMVEKVAEKMGGREWLKFGARSLSLFDPPELVANMNKLQSSILWRPSIKLDRGLEEVIEWWRGQA